MSAFITERIVEYAHTDMAGIVHYSEFFRYMESAEHEFFRSIGTSVHPQDDPDAPSWPRVSCRFDFKRPLRFEDRFQIHLSVLRLGEKSVTFASKIIFGDDTICAEGESTSVCCRMEGEGRMTSVPIPAPLRERLTALIENEETHP